MRSVKDPEDVLGGTLHAERDPGEPGRTKLVKRPLVNALWVRLGRYLRPRGQPELGVDRGEDRGQVGGRQQGGRPPAEEHRAYRRRACTKYLARQPDLVDSQAGVALPGRPAAEFSGGVRIEVAVSAPGRAERDVNVAAQRHGTDLV